MNPSIRVREIRFHRFDMETRFPFRYGIASMTEAPHLFVHATIEMEGQISRGVSADGLPPKWFTKNPDTTFEQDDLPMMLRVIRNASSVATQVGVQPNFFTWWHELYQTQQHWAKEEKIPSLLAGFGVSLIERAVLDAVCRLLQTPLHDVLCDNLLDIELGRIRAQLKSVTPADVLPKRPLVEIGLRHTIGLGDTLSDSDASSANRPDDKLPFTLEQNIKSYGLKYFKIKLSGDLNVDRDRLQQIAEITNRTVGRDARFTLDGNENYRTMSDFRYAWSELLDADVIRDFFEQSLLFVEQPVHRDFALNDSVLHELQEWSDAPKIIIDESDADLASLPTALSRGYSGTSHKNCKGIVKGLLNAATIHCTGGQGDDLILSAEDLGNVGPVALLQDLAMVACLGIQHVERNGHHYFAGLSMFPESIQQAMLAHHPDLYKQHRDFVALNPQQGNLSLRSVNSAPFGLIPMIDVEMFDEW